MTWSPERRAAHSALIQTLQPWKKSTGPRTPDGKQRSSRNALRHGRYAVQVLRFKALLAHHRQWLRLVRAHYEFHIFSRNELLAACRNIAQKDFCGGNSGGNMLYSGMKEPYV